MFFFKQSPAARSPQQVAKDLFGEGRSSAAAAKQQVAKSLFKEPASVEARTQAGQGFLTPQIPNGQWHILN